MPKHITETTPVLQISGTTAIFGAITGTSVSGTTAQLQTGVFQVLTGTTITGTVAQFQSGVYQILTGTISSGTTAQFQSGVYQILTGTFVSGTSGTFQQLTGTFISGTSAALAAITGTAFRLTSGSVSASYAQNLTPATATILNAPTGRFVMSSGSASFTVSSSYVSAQSIVAVIVESVDAAATGTRYTVPNAGYFVFAPIGAPAANLTASFVIYNGSA